VSDDESSAFARVRALVQGAKLLADGTSPLGKHARAELVVSTGLSPEGIELALASSLETNPTDAEITALCSSVSRARAAHVLLSANVFVAAHRAVALALAASSKVRVRTSRREPVFARLLAQAAPGLFEVVDELAPEAGDALFAYGSDETLEKVRRRLPAGVAFHPHGSGFGVAVVSERKARLAVAQALARDVALFDQRGCLSPRAVAFVGSHGSTRRFAAAVAEELEMLSERVPLGTLDPDEAAAVTRFRDAMDYTGLLHSAGPGFVGIGGERLVVAPVGRNLHFLRCDDPVPLLAPTASSIAALGFAVSPDLEARLRQALPGARTSALGLMQRPPFDGPVDRRSLRTARGPS
jgi:hypothetical protein